MPPFQLLHQLPQELLSDILVHLTSPDLSALNLASKWTYQHATPLLWREVTLTDRTTARPNGETDHHDDTPLLRKLLLLATRPHLAGHVQILHHACHLPPVGIFNELRKTPLSGQTMSFDPRTIELVRRAVAGMQRVHTLRVVFGHANLNDALLRCFFDVARVRQTPVRRLWLEDCRIAGGCDLFFPDHPAGLPAELDFSGLESVRLRRMPLRPAMSTDEVLPRFDFNHARGMRVAELQDGQGGLYVTTASDAWHESRTAVVLGQLVDEGFDGDEVPMRVEVSLDETFSLPMEWDDWNFEDLDSSFGLPPYLPDIRSLDYGTRAKMAWRGPLLDPGDSNKLPGYARPYQRERLPSARVAINMLRNASASLTSLCLDWVLAMPNNLAVSRDVQKHASWLELYADLFTLRFPNLRAFQYRNAVVPDTIIPPGLFLLDHAGRTTWRMDISLPEDLLKRLDLACLEFLEAHPNLQCLAWPMERFFSAAPTNPDIAHRVQAVIDNLGRTLVDLRIDTLYSPSGERQSENSQCDDTQARDQRRRFIADFASSMTRVESIKVEGGVPRDERRELLRALHRCPITKIVLIGVCSPLGNTWGAGGADLMTVGPALDVDEITMLEAEHKDAVHKLGHTKPEPLSSTFTFEPSYGWPPSPPMLHTLASHHAATVTELKFCGYKGAPVLFEPTPITAPLLAPLKHFHRLGTLIVSVCLLTNFEGAPRDAEIIQYWLDSRSPASTSLVRVSSGAEEDMGGWERELNTKFAPVALAGQVVRQMGPFLSEAAKGRTGAGGRMKGVRVRASMCLGDWGGIFDIDVDVGKDELGRDVCLGYEGPREELERGRRRGKLEGRRWF